MRNWIQKGVYRKSTSRHEARFSASLKLLAPKVVALIALGTLASLAACSNNGLPIDCPAPDQDNLHIHRAASCGASKPIFTRFIKAGEDINADDLYGNLAIHLVKDDRTLANVLAVGGDPNGLNAERETGLHNVARNQSGFTPKAVTLLLESGVHIDARNINGNTALHVAAQRTIWRRNDITRALIAAGSDINAQNRDGNTPMHLAVMQTKAKEIEIRDAIYAAGTFGLTLTYRYSQDGLGRGTLNMIELLAEQGADLTINNEAGLTAHQLVIQDKKNPSVQELFDTIIKARNQAK